MGTLFVAAAGFLPWGASGRRSRTSYELVAVLDRLEVLDGAGAAAAKAWYLAPLLAGATLLAAAARRPALARSLAGVVAAGGATLAVLTRRSPLLDRPGTSVTLLAAGVVGVGLVLALVERGRARD